MANENPIVAAENGTPKILTLRSKDGEQFSVSQSAAALSVTISNNMVAGGGVIPIDTVDGRTLSEVITYLNKHAAENGASDEEKKKFDLEFLSGKDISAVFAVAAAAHDLKINGLVDIATQKIADRLKDRSVELMRLTLRVVNDLTPEEEAEAVRLRKGMVFEPVDD